MSTVGIIANTTVTILRGESVDDYMDETDPPSPLYTGVVVSLLETSQQPTRRRDSRPQTLRYFTMRVVDVTLDLREDDRVRDEATNDVYTIEKVVAPNNPVFGRSLQADLLKVT